MKRVKRVRRVKRVKRIKRVRRVKRVKRVNKVKRVKRINRMMEVKGRERLKERTKGKPLFKKKVLKSFYFRILETTPAPTVLPPSRIANRMFFSIAIG